MCCIPQKTKTPKINNVIIYLILTINHYNFTKSTYNLQHKLFLHPGDA